MLKNSGIVQKVRKTHMYLEFPGFFRRGFSNLLIIKEILFLISFSSPAKGRSIQAHFS